MELMHTLPDKCFVLSIADPPYQLKKTSVRGAGKLKNRLLNVSDMSWDVAPGQEFFDELRRVSEHVIIWGGNYFNLPPCRCFVCWDKMQPWENFSQAEFAWTDFDKPAKVFRHTSRIKGKFHPTAKPIELYTYLYKTFIQGVVKSSTRCSALAAAVLRPTRWVLTTWVVKSTQNILRRGKSGSRKNALNS